MNFVDSTGDNNVSQAIKETTAFAEGTIFARDLANERADEMTPGKLESIARSLAAETGAELHVVSGTDLLDKGLHLLYNVGQAAGMAREEHQPRYIELNYKVRPLDHIIMTFHMPIFCLRSILDPRLFSDALLLLIAGRSL